MGEAVGVCKLFLRSRSAGHRRTDSADRHVLLLGDVFSMDVPACGGTVTGFCWQKAGEAGTKLVERWRAPQREGPRLWGEGGWGLPPVWCLPDRTVVMAWERAPAPAPGLPQRSSELSNSPSAVSVRPDAVEKGAEMLCARQGPLSPVRSRRQRGAGTARALPGVDRLQLQLRQP